MPASSANKVTIVMGETVALTIVRLRQAVTNVIGVLYLAAALVVLVPGSSGSAWGQAPNWPRSITIGTASPGGSLFGP